MYIRCWGSRGSIAVSGKEYIKYGGETTCMEVRSDDGRIVVIDAGTGARKLGLKLAKEKVTSFNMLFTHAHLDHLMGFPFFVPLYQRGVGITIRGYPFNRESYRDILSGLMSEPFFPVLLTDNFVRARLRFRNILDKPFRIGSLKITQIFLSHPRNGGLGYKFEEKGKTFVFLTDNELGFTHNGGLSFDDYVEFCRGADLLIHDAEYDPKDYQNNRSWGHSLFTDAVKLGLASEVKQLGLFHLNQNRTDVAMDRMVQKSKNLVGKKNSKMKVFAVGEGFEATLQA